MINYRALIITAAFLIVFTALVLKLFSIQISNKDYYSLVAEKQQYKPQIVKAERGVIQDANGDVLCFTRNNISFFVDTRMMDSKKVDSISSVFAKAFNKSQKYYRQIIENGIRNVCLEKKVPMEQAAKLKNTFIDGLFYEEDFTRTYPYGSLASHVLGYVKKK
jgi:cell division protein FtsI/penicillin-binding protein 2